MRASLAQPIRFAMVGAGGYVVNLGVFAALYRLGGRYLAASLAAYFASNALMYVGNRYFTFGLMHDGFVAAYLRYVLVGGVVAAFTAALLAVLVEGTGVDPRLGQALSLLAIMPVAFFLIRRWTFQLKPV